MRIGLLVSGLLVLVVVVMASRSQRCASERDSGVWCERCGVGHVAGVRVPSPALFEVIDAHGHDIDPGQLTCVHCVEAVERDGFCTRCRMGFVDSQAYLSRLAYGAATGSLEAVQEDVDRLRAAVKVLDRCERCAIATFTLGRCRVCRLSYATGAAVAIGR